MAAALLLAASASEVYAQVSPETLTAQEFISRIDGKLPELEHLEAVIAGAEANVVAAEALAPLALSYEREEVFTEGEGVALKNALSLGWSLDISGSRGHRIEGAKLEVEAIRQSNEYRKRLLTLGALKIYKRAARARLRVQSLQETRGPLSTLVEKLKNRSREGDASGYDLARFELELVEHDDLFTEANMELAVAQGQLAALLGLVGGQVVASDELQLPVSVVANEGQIGAPRSDLLATESEEASGKALQKAASRWWIPTLDLSVGYLSTDFGPGTGPGADVAHGYTGMVSAVVPLFSRGQAEQARGQARVRQARADRLILERQIGSEVQAARTLLRAQIEQANIFRESQLVQTASLAQKSEVAYQGGEVSSLELRDAYAKASAARLRYIELRYQCSLAEIALWSATGTLGNGESK